MGPFGWLTGVLRRIAAAVRSVVARLRRARLEELKRAQRPPRRASPIWLKLAYTGFVAVLLPFYVANYGPLNFLWFSDIALLVTVVALWQESRLLASTMAVGTLALELV